MGIRFAKSIKLGNLLKINISKSGISATVGKKGASVNIGSKGTYLNLSPTVAGITGTGLSYRQKITGGYGSLLSNLTGKGKNDGKKAEVSEDDIKNIKAEEIDSSVIEEYENNLIASINVHKLADKVITENDYLNKVNNEQSDALKQVYKLSYDGDEDTIESLVGSFMSNFDFAYPTSASYELEDHVLYVDLDLPEIEDIFKEYPTVVKDKIINKKKTQKQLKQEYAYTVMSLSAYLGAQFFNLSSYITEIVLSGFTTVRNNEGDKCDQYLYSIKYTRDKFEGKDLDKVDDIYAFINEFENRINFNSDTCAFKEIKPFEMPSVQKANSLIEEAISGLKQLGYKNAKIQEILPKLNELNLESSGEYLKEALKLISSNE